MKYFALFLVLALLTMTPEPGEAFIGHIFRGILHVGKTIHGLIKRHGKYDADVVVLEERAAE